MSSEFNSRAFLSVAGPCRLPVPDRDGKGENCPKHTPSRPYYQLTIQEIKASKIGKKRERVLQNDPLTAFTHLS